MAKRQRSISRLANKKDTRSLRRWTTALKALMDKESSFFPLETKVKWQINRAEGKGSLCHEEFQEDLKLRRLYHD